MKIDPYTGSEQQMVENNLVLRKVWYFVGLTHFLNKPNDFFVRTVAGEEVVITFDGANVFAVINRCPHRGARIISDKCGNKDLTCPFHGWYFKADGKLKSIPYENEKYKFSGLQKDGISLTLVHVKIVGRFIFVNLDQGPVDISEQIPSSMLEELELISAHLDDAYSLTHIPSTANWKLLAEIVFDELHVPFVHSNTFAKLLKYEMNSKVDVNSELASDLRVEPPVVEAEPCNDFWSCARELSFSIATQNPKLKSEVWHSNVSRYRRDDHYYDFYIFPNLHLISASGGHSFSYCAYFPEDIDRTVVDYLFTTAKVKNFDHIIPIAHLESMRMGLTIYEEDVRMMEQVQQSAVPGFSPVHGEYEAHIVKWRRFFQEFSNA